MTFWGCKRHRVSLLCTHNGDGDGDMASNGRTSNWIRGDKRLAIYLRDGLCCAYCGAGVESGVQLTLDHVVAHNLGGSNRADNLVTCCLSCNSRKQDVTLRAWYRRLRSEGMDTAPIARRVRRNTAKSIAPFRATAKAMMAARNGASCAAVLAEVA